MGYTMTNGFIVKVKEQNRDNEADIPAFPTIALPMMAIIGLALIFRRKEESDSLFLFYCCALFYPNPALP